MNLQMNTSDYQSQYLESLLSGNHINSSRIISDYSAQVKDLKILYDQIIKRALYEVGNLWEQNKISVATEHMASSIVEANLNQLYPSIVSAEKRGLTAVIACIESEMHQIGGKMVCDIFELNGWNVHFLGANTPTKDLFSFISTMKPLVLGISLSIYFHIPTLKSIVVRATEEFPEMKIMIGGQAFQHGGVDEFEGYPNVTFKSNLDEVDEYIKQF